MTTIADPIHALIQHTPETEGFSPIDPALQSWADLYDGGRHWTLTDLLDQGNANGWDSLAGAVEVALVDYRPANLSPAELVRHLGGISGARLVADFMAVRPDASPNELKAFIKRASNDWW